MSNMQVVSSQNHDGAGAEHGAGIGQRFEVQFNFDH